MIHPLMQNREEPAPILIIRDLTISSVEDLGVMVSLVYHYDIIHLVCDNNFISFITAVL